MILHDVLEHIADKERLLCHAAQFLREGGSLWVVFSDWRSPFGGHQQMVRNGLVSHCPYIHLLPRIFYRFVLRFAGERESTIDAFLSLRENGITAGRFEQLVRKCSYSIADRRFYFINPCYYVRFGAYPVRMWSWLAKVPLLRGLLSTTCYYLLRPAGER